MNEETMQQLVASAARMASAAASLEGAVARLDARHEALQSKVEHILAAIDERFVGNDGQDSDGEDNNNYSNYNGGEIKQLRQQVTELKKSNTELQAQSGRLSRRTLTPMVNALLTKSGVATDDQFDREALDKALQPLSIEQRIAVKAEMARAGLIS